MIELSIDRAAIALPPLVITENPAGAAFHLPEDAVGEVGWTLRRDYSPDSAYIGGKTLLSVVEEAATLPLVIYAIGDTTAQVEARKVELRAATTQWTYPTTVTIDGVATTYWCEPQIPTWGPVDSGMVRGHRARGVLVIPVNP